MLNYVECLITNIENFHIYAQRQSLVSENILNKKEDFRV